MQIIYEKNGLDRTVMRCYSMEGQNPSNLLGINKRGGTGMKLSTKGRYGLRALIDLAVHEEDDTVSIQSISERQGISESYLEQLVRLLKKAELVVSVRGAGGGYRLAKPAEDISVGDILRALEGDLNAVACSAYQEEQACEGADCCVTKFVWKKINDAITQTVDSIKLAELVSESRKLLERNGAESVQRCNN